MGKDKPQVPLTAMHDIEALSSGAISSLILPIQRLWHGRRFRTPPLAGHSGICLYWILQMDNLWRFILSYTISSFLSKYCVLQSPRHAVLTIVLVLLSARNPQLRICSRT
jgi:hypothetical protein